MKRLSLKVVIVFVAGIFIAGCSNNGLYHNYLMRGQVVEIKDINGEPEDKFWQRRLYDAQRERDDRIEVISNNEITAKETNTKEKTEAKTEKKEEVKTEENKLVEATT